MKLQAWCRRMFRWQPPSVTIRSVNGVPKLESNRAEKLSQLKRATEALREPMRSGRPAFASAPLDVLAPQGKAG